MFSVTLRQLGRIPTRYCSQLVVPQLIGVHHLTALTSSCASGWAIHKPLPLLGRVCAFSSSSPAGKTALTIDSTLDQVSTSLRRSSGRQKEKHGEVPIDYLDEGSKKQTQRDFQQATKLYTLAILNEKDPYRIAVSRYFRGLTYRITGQFDQAITDFSDLLCQKNRFLQTDAFRGLSDVYQAKGEDSKAIKVLEEGIKTIPQSIHLYYELGKLHLKMKNIPQALPYFEKAVGLIDTTPSAELDDKLTQLSQHLQTVTIPKLRTSTESETIYTDLSEAQARFPIYTL